MDLVVAVDYLMVNWTLEAAKDVDERANQRIKWMILGMSGHHRTHRGGPLNFGSHEFALFGYQEHLKMEL